MALGGSNDKLQGSTGGSTVSSSKPSRPSSSSSSSNSSKPVDVYQQMANAAQDANLNNLSGTNTTKPDHYGDGSSTGENNPNGVGGLPSSSGGGSSSKPNKNAVGVTGPLADEINEPDKPSAQDQYAQIIEDDYQWWEENHLPLYYEALHDYRGGNFDSDLTRADQTTGAAFTAAKGDVERAARGFGVNADIDQVKWDAMEASQKSGNRAALAPRVTQDQLANARQVNLYGGPTSDKGQKIMMGEPIDKMAPVKDQWKKDGSGFGVTTR